MTSVLPSKNLLKLIRSLQQKKQRKESGLFVVEGEKAVAEVLQSTLPTQYLLYTEQFSSKYPSLCHKATERYITDNQTIESTGFYQSNSMALAVVHIPQSSAPTAGHEVLTLLLDGINDPGNLGTIVRTADWFGIRQIVCTPDTVDFYNPKCIAAAKGSFCRIIPHYTEVDAWLRLQKSEGVNIYGAAMDGIPITQITVNHPAILILGSEASGIRPEAAAFIHQKISIPGSPGAESLNVGIAAGILMYAFAKH